MKYIILSSLLMSACAHTVVPDPKKCCERVSLHNEEMEKFTRYCKVALFLHRGDTINDKKVKELSKRAVNVCMFVFVGVCVGGGCVYVDVRCISACARVSIRLHN